MQDQEFLKKHTSGNKLLLTSENGTPVELNKGIVIQRVDMKITHDEADNIIVQQMVAGANKNQKGISVLSDDTDVFVLLLYHYLELSLKLPVIMESPIKDRKTVDIRETVRKTGTLYLT